MEKGNLHSYRTTTTRLCVMALLGLLTKQQVTVGATSADTEYILSVTQIKFQTPQKLYVPV